MSRGHRSHRFFGRLAAVGGSFLIVSSLLLSVAVPAALAADTGAKAASATTSPNGWTNPANAYASDNVYATARGDNIDQGYTGFGIDLPAGSIIDGIQVNAEAKSSDNSGCELQVALGSGGSLTSNDTASLTGTDSTLTFGDDDDTWGRVWDPTQIDDLVVRVRANDPGNGCNDGGANSTATASLDSLSVVVTYRTVKGGTANPALAKGVCNQADFNFVIDMSGSVGPQDGRPSNLPQLQAGIIDFVDAFAAAGGDGIYSGTRFNGTSANTLTSGYDSPAAFKADVAGLSGPTGTTPTSAGITTGAGNDSGDRAGVPNVLFVVTDGSPNVPGGDLADPPTWLQAANAAVDAADAARADGYVVKAIYLSTAGDPGDTTLPFSDAGDAQWAQKVMREIGGGSYLNADFKDFVKDLFEAIKCAPPPTVQLTKSVDDDSKPEPGGTFTYTLAIKNTADHDVQITALTDDHDLSPACDALVGTWLDAGETVTCDYQVVHSTIGSHENTASVTVEDEDGGTAEDSDDETVRVTDILPEVSIDKSVTPGSRPEPGGVFTFTLKITNISNETFVIDALDDDYPLSAACLDLVGDSLAPGASVSCQYTVSRSDAGTYDNTASVDVSDDEGNEDSDSDDASFQVTDQAPVIVVDKAASPSSRPEPGGSFTYTVTVTNLSDETVTITALSDDRFGNLAGKGTCAIGAELDPDEQYSCQFSGSVTGNAGLVHTNVVTATAEDDEGTEDSDTDDATVTITDVKPTITVDKTATPLTRAEPGGTFTFNVTVTNTSSESVTITGLSDDVHGNLAGKGTCAIGAVLAPAGQYGCSFTASFTGNAGDSETDVVTATAVDDDGSTATDTDDATVRLTDVPPTVSVDKTADPVILDEPGGSVTFTVKVTNTSFEPVTLTSLVDDVHGDLDGRDSCATGGTIAPSATYECAFSADVAGNAGDFETDTITAVVADDEGTEAEDEDSATVTIVNVDPAISVVKTATPLTKPEPGGSFRFDVTVTNDSAEAVELISLIDDVYGDLDGQGTCAVGAELAADGGSYSCYFGGTFLGNAGDEQTDIVIATVRDDDGAERSAFDDATVGLTDEPPTLDVIKTADPEIIEAGTEVTFSVTVINTSAEDVWLDELVDSIHGDLDGVGTCVADGSVKIAPKAQYQCEFTAVVNETETDVITATVADDEENEASDDDDATVTVVDLTIDKSVVNATADRGQTQDGAVKAKPGDTLTYLLAYTVVEGPLHGVVITDDLPTGLGTPSSISDGGVWDAATRRITWDLGTVEGDGFVTYDVVVAAAAKGAYENVATIDSDETSPDDDDADAEVVPDGDVQGETSKPTLPPTDVVAAPAAPAAGGPGVMLALLVIGGLAFVAALSATVPGRRGRRPR
jgi:hypothetical protein